MDGGEDRDDAAQRLRAIEELRKTIASSPGWPIRRDFHALARTYRLFLGNDRELRTFLSAKADVQEVFELWDLKNTEGFEQFLDEVDRLLHNYVAAVCTVRDHTRNVWKAHVPNVVTVQAEYGERVAKTFVTPHAQFVQRLRNFTLHERLPLARGHLAWNRESGHRSRVILDLEQLRRGKRWTATARQYLDEASGDIDLLDLVDSYSTLVVDFNGWFGRAFLGAHLNAIEEVKRLEVQLRSVYPEF